MRGDAAGVVRHGDGWCPPVTRPFLCPTRSTSAKIYIAHGTGPPGPGTGGGDREQAVRRAAPPTGTATGDPARG